MAQAVEKTASATLLCAVYRNAKDATAYLLGLMPRVEDEQLKHDMTVQISVYEGFASRAAKLLAEEGEGPEDESVMQKMGNKVATMIESMRVGTTARIAKALSDATQARADEMLSLIREQETRMQDGEPLHLARHLNEYEREQVDLLRAYRE